MTQRDHMKILHADDKSHFLNSPKKTNLYKKKHPDQQQTKLQQKKHFTYSMQF